ncbi:MAG: HlyD family efflux transporter periplasmic adaptor subunit [Mesorhizobium sp.]|uniref:efflux RND transporter periplasmic adaptor subunit n=1 Tax=unclassified Mesorhizobium TaxID=325217 RepID=UPI000FCC0C39|nr:MULTISPECIES: HlyD family efflux transporter periplasmic adaptor subunit [unclassified Mesorhizobium]RUV66632.1 HlyD family efflux transporter periplasmic adaptor subunit [Mesorhizobium sp. M5C.F.Cr.IN.023.01.1.1]RWF88702.1 MAG: HlyD family efflux transporter periplasmic adaptor subunit [Mesorhizobium sp.]RWF92908.1 MAG: HlyD family efflux transporter periplasmic adaptor subunit [Mesorhizobium sp.]RWI41229.1 MAG: HlyD family efflux transporter periplasmic adaptor subunit [Mesorhizobium sp.]
MRTKWMKRIGGAAVGLIAVAAIWFAWPQPIPVDLAMVARGPMEVTVDDEAKTEVRHVYTLSAPIAGKVLRISPPLHVGDQVTQDETVVAVMQPTTPSFHDIRTHEELLAALGAADAALTAARAEVKRIEATLAYSRTLLQRAEKLVRTEAISQEALDKAKFNVEANEAALASAKAQVEVRRNEQSMIQARLGQPADDATRSDPACCIQLRAPVSGRVLNIIQESEGMVQAGAPLVEIGDPLDLQVVADLLSIDAVQIKPGAAVRIDGWGGEALNGKVTRVDPAGFLKVSALGIEEQRVHTEIDFVDPPEFWSALGHDYRVIVHVTSWQDENALTVPVAALFRQGDDWAVYVVKDGRARTSIVKIGQRNSRVAQIESGLAAGDRVVLHPSDRVADGARVQERIIR